MKKLAFLLLACVLVHCGKKTEGPPTPVTQPGPAPEVPAYRFTLVDDRWPDRPFIVDLPASNADGVKSFEKYLTDGKVPTDPDGFAAVGIVTGTVVKGGEGWSFGLDPATVTFADMTAEVCDGTFEYVEQHLDEWMASVKTYCPWSTSRLIRKIEKSGEPFFTKGA